MFTKTTFHITLVTNWKKAVKLDTPSETDIYIVPSVAIFSEYVPRLQLVVVDSIFFYDKEVVLLITSWRFVLDIPVVFACQHIVISKQFRYRSRDKMPLTTAQHVNASDALCTLVLWENMIISMLLKWHSFPTLRWMLRKGLKKKLTV